MTNTFGESLNPLHSFILIAQALKQIMLTEYGEQNTYPEVIIPTADSWITEEFPKASSGQILYPNKELGGVAGLYTWLQQHSYQVIFANDLAQEIHGIDAIAKSPYEDSYLICESKGTTHPFKTPREYLKKTKSKGRQLTWKWCWRSLIDMAELGPTANTFLDVLPVFLEGRVKRLLSVTKLTFY